MIVSILIPVHDDINGLRITLESLSSLDKNSHEVEIIVCNDGGLPTISELAIKFGCRLVEYTENRGSYAARNLGLQVATGEVFAFVDADEKVDAEWLNVGLEALKNADYVGGTIKIQLPPKPTAWESYDHLAAFPVHYYLDRRHFAPTANLFVRREVFQRIGSFEEALKSGGDCEFGVRVHKAGFKMLHCSGAVTYHPARNFGEQVRKVCRVAQGATELEYLVWQRPASFILRQASVSLLKAPLRALARIPGIARPPVSGGNGWKAHHHLMWGVVKVIYHWLRIRYMLQLLVERRVDSWTSGIKVLPDQSSGRHDRAS